MAGRLARSLRRLPPLARRPDKRGIEAAGLGLSKGGIAHLRLDLAPLGVELIEAFGHGAGLGGITTGQEARAQVRLADAAPGIDARPQQKAQMIGIWGGVHPRHV